MQNDEPMLPAGLGATVGALLTPPGDRVDGFKYMSSCLLPLLSQHGRNGIAGMMDKPSRATGARQRRESDPEAAEALRCDKVPVRVLAEVLLKTKKLLTSSAPDYIGKWVRDAMDAQSIVPGHAGDVASTLASAVKPLVARSSAKVWTDTVRWNALCYVMHVAYMHVIGHEVQVCLVCVDNTDAYAHDSGCGQESAEVAKGGGGDADGPDPASRKRARSEPV